MRSEGWPTDTRPETGPWFLLPALTPDFPSLSEPARSTKLILEVMYFSSDKVREWAYETSKQRSDCQREELLIEQAPGESAVPPRLFKEPTLTST